jgi:hypothetical protein
MSQTASLVTAKEAAVIANKSVATIKRYALTGRLKHAMKLPGDTGAYLFNRKDVEKLAKAS